MAEVLDEIDYLLQCFSSSDPIFHLTTSEDDFSWLDATSLPPPPIYPHQQSPESLVAAAAAAAPPNASSSEGSSSSSSSSSSGYHVREIEKLLMTEDDVQDPELQDDFFADLFKGSEEGVKSSIPRTEIVTEAKTPIPESDHVDQKEASLPLPSASVPSKGVEEDGDGPISKKRKRQIRNRDSAMKSRERKKMYVKELEMKSKYLEEECRRLDYALRCCAAENLVLHQRLQERRAFGASTAKQESAELFVESLLLVSLFWLVSITCLSLMSSLLSWKPGRSISGMESSLDKRGVVRGKQVEDDISSLKLQSFPLRRCRGMRTRIKSCSSALNGSRLKFVWLSICIR